MWREARGGTEDHNDVEEHGGDDEDVGDKEEGGERVCSRMRRAGEVEAIEDGSGYAGGPRVT